MAQIPVGTTSSFPDQDPAPVPNFALKAEGIRQLIVFWEILASPPPSPSFKSTIPRFPAVMDARTPLLHPFALNEAAAVGKPGKALELFIDYLLHRAWIKWFVGILPEPRQSSRQRQPRECRSHRDALPPPGCHTRCRRDAECHRGVPRGKSLPSGIAGCDCAEPTGGARQRPWGQ